jgi:hypothetical protein
MDPVDPRITTLRGELTRPFSQEARTALAGKRTTNDQGVVVPCPPQKGTTTP